MPPRRSQEAQLERLRAEETRLLTNLAECRAYISDITGEEAEEAPVTQLDEFLAERNTDFDWIIGGSLARGSVGMVVADPAVGKTTLLVQLALCLSAGRSPWYDAPVGRAFQTLYVSAEGSRGAFQGRVRTARESLGIPTGTGWFIQRQGVTDYQIGGHTLEAMIRKSKAELVILDTIGYFWKGDENSAVEWKAQVMKPLRDLIARHGTTFLLVHHQIKATPGREGWQRARGTSAMFADLDAFFQLEAVDTDPTGMKRVFSQAKNKYGLTGKWELTFDPAQARFG
jgi:RecA-family ATPase